MLAGSVCVCFGDGAEESSGGQGVHGGEEHPAVPAALCPQREGELRMSSLKSPQSLSFAPGSETWLRAPVSYASS